MNSIFPLLSLGPDDNFYPKTCLSLNKCGWTICHITNVDGGWNVECVLLLSKAPRACSHEIAKSNETSEWVVEVQLVSVHAYCVGERKGRRFLFGFVYRLSPFLSTMF